MPAKNNGSTAANGRTPNLPSSIAWQETTLVRTGGFSATPVPTWAIESVQKSYDAFKADAEAPALSATFTDEAQAKSVLHQLRRAATQLNVGLAAKIEGKVLTFAAREKKVINKPQPAAGS